MIEESIAKSQEAIQSEIAQPQDLLVCPMTLPYDSAVSLCRCTQLMDSWHLASAGDLLLPDYLALSINLDIHPTEAQETFPMAAGVCHRQLAPPDLGTLA